MSYPPPQGFPPPQGYGGYPPPAPQQSNGMATAALVFGILSLVCFPAFGLVAVPLGIAGLSRAKRINGNGRGLAIGGIVTGVLGILASIAIVVVLVIGANEIDSDTPDGSCNEDRYLQDPDCGSGGINTDTSDGVCDEERFLQDPDC